MATIQAVAAAAARHLKGEGQDALTSLTGDLDSSSLSFIVDDPGSIANGSLIEIDAEQMRVKSVDGTTNAVTLFPFGRGFNSTIATAHSSGAMVSANPQFPFSTLVGLINEVIDELYGMGLVAVKTVDAPYTLFDPYALPADAVTPLAVLIQDTTTLKWYRVDRWSYSATGDNRLSVPLAGDSTPTRVVYAAAPGRLDASLPASDWTTVTGYPDRVASLVGLGVGYRLAAESASARLGRLGAEAKADAAGKPVSEGRLLSQVLYAEYQQRVNGELLNQRREYPISLHRTV